VSPASEVYIVKEDGPTKQALTSLLTTAGFPSRAFDNVGDFLDARDGLPPGCVIASLQPPGMDAFEFLRRLGEGRAAFPAIMIAEGGDAFQAVKAMKAGAATVLERPYGDEALLGAVRSVLEVDARAVTQSAQRAALARLTHREQEVLDGLLEGESNKMVARRLSISPRTVESYRAAMMKKIGLHSVPELVRLVIDVARLH
jgi:two-component system response regulator FixJ